MTSTDQLPPVTGKPLGVQKEEAPAHGRVEIKRVDTFSRTTVLIIVGLMLAVLLGGIAIGVPFGIAMEKDDSDVDSPTELGEVSLDTDGEVTGPGVTNAIAIINLPQNTSQNVTIVVNLGDSDEVLDVTLEIDVTIVSPTSVPQDAPILEIGNFTEDGAEPNGTHVAAVIPHEDGTVEQELLTCSGSTCTVGWEEEFTHSRRLKRGSEEQWVCGHMWERECSLENVTITHVNLSWSCNDVKGYLCGPLLEAGSGSGEVGSGEDGSGEAGSGESSRYDECVDAVESVCGEMMPRKEAQDSLRDALFDAMIEGDGEGEDEDEDEGEDDDDERRNRRALHGGHRRPWHDDDELKELFRRVWSIPLEPPYAIIEMTEEVKEIEVCRRACKRSCRKTQVSVRNVNSRKGGGRRG